MAMEKTMKHARNSEERGRVDAASADISAFELHLQQLYLYYKARRRRGQAVLVVSSAWACYNVSVWVRGWMESKQVTGTRAERFSRSAGPPRTGRSLVVSAGEHRGQRRPSECLLEVHLSRQPALRATQVRGERERRSKFAGVVLRRRKGALAPKADRASADQSEGWGQRGQQPG
ncbi:unnamed protein product [Ectocarpus sp. CCAP 1310/34]|nr:unnamed protein product [Ectocarpus sp. CCAP 1310/34]